MWRLVMSLRAFVHSTVVTSSLAGSLCTLIIEFPHLIPATAGAAESSWQRGGQGPESALALRASQAADDRRATEFVQSEIDAHWAKTTDGWTTKFQRKNTVGDVLPGEPNLLYRQIKELSFTLEPIEVDEDAKQAGTTYAATISFAPTQERFYRKVDMEEGPKGWSAWQDAAISPFVTVERRHGKWILNADDLLKGVRANASKVPSD